MSAIESNSDQFDAARGVGAEVQSSSGIRLTGPRISILLLTVAFILALLLYFPTLSLSFGYDDIDYFNGAADVLAGKEGFWESTLRPQGVHFVPLLRVLWLINAAVFGTFGVPFRVLALASHALSAAILGMLAWHYSKSLVAAFATSVSYVGAAGFSSMWIWFPSASTVLFSISAYLASALLIANGEHLGWKRSRILAAMVACVAVGFDSTHVPLICLPMFLDVWERMRRDVRRPIGWFTGFCAVVMVATVMTASYLYSVTYGPKMPINLIAGIPKAAFLLLVAPFRLLLPGFTLSRAADLGLPMPVMASLCGLVIAMPALALLVSLWRKSIPALAQIALVLCVGPVGVVTLVGLGRWSSSYFQLYYSDRYFFTLMIPTVLLIGAASASIFERAMRWPMSIRGVLGVFLIAFMTAELVLHRFSMLERISFDVYDAHQKRFAQLSHLTELLGQRALDIPENEPPLRFPDTDLWFPEIHNGRLSTRFLLYVIGHDAGHRLVLGDSRVSARDASIVNSVLEEWAADVGEGLPYLSIDDGVLTDHHVVSRVDFGHGSGDSVVVEGFYDWEGHWRWMGESGTLRLTMTESGLFLTASTAAEALNRIDPEFSGVPVKVTIQDEASGIAVDLQQIVVVSESPALFFLDTSPFSSRFGNGRVVHVMLKSGFTWRPKDVIPESGDERRLSILVLRAGFGNPD